MKFLILLILNFLLSNLSFAETTTTKSEILRKSNECFKNSQNQFCEELIFTMEKLQIFEFEQDRFKCQSSILGLQTELIKAHYFQDIPKMRNGIMRSYVIKNC